MEKKHYIEDFIGTFDGFVSPEICKKLIDLFEKEQQYQKNVFSRQMNGWPKTKKNDLSFFLTRDHDGLHGELLNLALIQFREALDLYLKETDFLSFASIKNLHFVNNKIQKTYPSGGYHVWHVEKDYNKPCGRALVYTIYLNDILEGGETEFLFQKLRVPPKQGRVCIFPAHFPYVHRGNPPLKETKYILTSWLHAGYEGIS